MASEAVEATDEKCQESKVRAKPEEAKDKSDSRQEESATKNSDSDSGIQNQVVLRKGKSSEAQRRALATRRRMVQSMIVESSSGMSSLCSPNPSPPSPAIEKENPFREAMMKFAAMEAEDAEKKAAKKKVKAFSTKSTETLTPSKDSKATQTSSPSFVASRTEDSSFRTCLRSQLSCPAGNSTSNLLPTQAATRPRAPSTGPLSYTSTPRPYTSQSMTALNRSMSNIPNNSPISPPPPPMIHVRQEQRATPTPAHRRPLSMLVSESPDFRLQQQRSPGHHPLPGTAYTPPIYQHHVPANSYSQHLTNSPLWSPNCSIYLTPMGNGSPSSGYASTGSVYSTPVGSSPCRNMSRYPSNPGNGSANSSPVRYRPMNGYHVHPDRLQLHIEGQSSLV